MNGLPKYMYEVGSDIVNTINWADKSYHVNRQLQLTMFDIFLNERVILFPQKIKILSLLIILAKNPWDTEHSNKVIITPSP